MANMSYCRFHNTNLDLVDCLETLNEQESLSDEEFESCKDMFHGFIDFLIQEGIIDCDYEEEVEENLEEFFETINVGD